MEEYQQRVIKEQEELQNKIDKLQLFLGVHPIDRSHIILYEQLVHMQGYNKVLLRRISEFKEN